jgi:hypothetical protein
LLAVVVEQYLQVNTETAEVVVEQGDLELQLDLR